MKLYAFYKIKNAKKKILDVPELYAFTYDKEIKDEFIKQRNMEIFHLIVKNMSKNDTKEFSKRFNRQELKYHEMYTKSEFDESQKRKIKVLTTWNEVESAILKVDIIFDELSKYVSPSVFYLKNEYIKDLDVLYYLTVFKFFKDKLVHNSYLFSGLESYEEDKEIMRINLDYDEFKLYMYYVAYTYK